MRSVLRRPVFNIEFEWIRPRTGVTTHGPESPLIPNEWKPRENSPVTVQEIVDGPSEVFTLPSEANWFSITLSDKTLERYKPLKTQALMHREFCEIPRFPVSPEEIAKFADMYGLLGIGSIVPTGSGALMIESTSQWDSAIGSMQEAVQLWDNLSDSSLSGADDLGQSIKRTSQGFWYQSPALKKAIAANPALANMLEEYHKAYEEWGFLSLDDDNYVAGPLRHDELRTKWQSKTDNLGPAKQHLVNIVNQHLIGNVVPQFSLIVNMSGNEDIITSITPQNLLGALWLQFFLEITWRNVRKCLMCGKPFIAKRENQLYCDTHGTGCRKRAYHARNEVLRDGKPKIEVAHRYHITVADLDKILAQGRGRKE